MTTLQIADWDDAYANIAHIPGGAAFPDGWARDAAAFRAIHPPEPGPGENGGGGALYLPGGSPRGLVVFVHGGYWMKFGPGWFSHLAAGPLARGWAVLLPAYPLAPAGTLRAMRDRVAAAIGTAARGIAGPVVVAGHSAGGHLAVRMICDDTPLDGAVLSRVARCVPVSGLFDLRPLQRTVMRGDLGLDDATVRAESPLFHEPLAHPALHLWVGAAERPVFLRQSQLLAAAWGGIPAETRLTVEPGRHHMDVISGLTDPYHPLTEAVVGGL